MTTCLTADQRAKYERYLEEAEEALHQLSMGKRVATFVDENGERVEYTGATRAQLLAYVQDLQAKLGKLSISGPLGTFI